MYLKIAIVVVGLISKANGITLFSTLESSYSKDFLKRYAPAGKLEKEKMLEFKKYVQARIFLESENTFSILRFDDKRVAFLLCKGSLHGHEIHYVFGGSDLGSLEDWHSTYFPQTKLLYRLDE